MLASNYSFQKIVLAPSGTVTEICRRAFRAWGQLPIMTHDPEKEATQVAAANMLLFNHTHITCTPKRCKYGCTRSDTHTEVTADGFAREGLTRLKHIIVPGQRRMLAPAEFAARFPTLSKELYACVRNGIRPDLSHVASSPPVPLRRGDWVSRGRDVGQVERVDGRRVQVHVAIVDIAINQLHSAGRRVTLSYPHSCERVTLRSPHLRCVKGGKDAPDGGITELRCLQ
eukprot:520529-Prymnesium_polylepis.1